LCAKAAKYLDRVYSPGHYYRQMSDQAIAPVGQSRSNVEVFRSLAEHLGFTGPCFQDSADELIDQALLSGRPWLKGIDASRGPKPARAVPWQRSPLILRTANSSCLSPGGEFPAPSGKAELYNESLIAEGLDPVASFVPPSESRSGGRDVSSRAARAEG
jgi:anaerobic selenocysteine-containing dehydrogenase